MHIYMLGWNWKHPDTFAIERPNGHFGMQLILVRSKGRVKMDDKEYRVNKNTAFLVESCLPHCLYADGEEYADDWIRFSIDHEADGDFMDSLQLEFNVPIVLQDDAISQMIAAGVEIFKSDAAQKNETLNYLLRAILRHISEYVRQPDKRDQNYYTEALDRIRREIYDDPAHDWKIPEIAENLSISVSHFQRLYKKRFGVSCMNDVFISRMNYAKKLLLETDYSAKEIAYMCGYQNYENFSRTFVKYGCISPVQYRSKYKEK